MWLAWFLASACFYTYSYDVTSPKGLPVNLEQGWTVSELLSDRAVLTSLDQSENCNISDVKQPARPQGRGIGLSGRTIEDEQCQRIGGGYEAVKFRFLLFP